MGEDLIPGSEHARVGEYAIVQRLGADRNTERFRARRGALRTDFLVKILDRELDSDSSVAERMQARAEAALGFRHPNVLALLDYGWDGGRFFWVSEWAEAEMLQDLLRDRGLLGAEAAVEIALDVAQALQGIHAAGMVHGDITSANVFLTPAWDAKLADLGVAPALAVDDSVLDVAGDIYAVGVLLGEMLTGSMLGGAPPGTDPLGGRPLAPAAPSVINPQVPAAIDSIVLRALTPDPADQFETAGDLYSALAAWRQSRLEGLIWGDPTTSGSGPSASLSPLSRSSFPPTREGTAPPGPSGQWAPGTSEAPPSADAELEKEGDGRRGSEGVIMIPNDPLPWRGSKASDPGALGVVLRRVLLAALLILFVDSVYVVASLPFALGTARAQLEQGSRDLRAGNYEAADDHFVRSLADSNRAVGVTRHPPFLILASLPWAGRDPSAMGEMAEATRLAALAGVAASRGFIEMDAPPGGPPAAIFGSRTVRLRALREGAPFFARSRELLTESRAILDGAPVPNLGFVAGPLTTERAAVGEALASLATFDTVADLLPSLAGGGAERRYLFVVENLALARGGGGAIEYAGVLQATDGHLRLTAVEPVDSLAEPDMAAGAMRWFSREYGPWGALDSYSRVNFSPRFATVAPVLLDQYAGSTGESLDGVISVDSAALGGLTSVSGPVTGPGYGAELNGADASVILDRHLYRDLDDAARDRFVSGAVQNLWRKVNSVGADLGALPSILADLTTRGHVKVYSRHPEDQAALVELGAVGDPGRLGHNVQSVWHNNLTSIPVDSYLTKSTDTQVQLTEGAGAAVVTEVTLDNGAGPGTAGWLSAYGGELGLNRMRLTWLLPAGARVHELLVGGEPAEYDIGHEGRYPVVSTILEVPGGSAIASSLAYTMAADAGAAGRPSFDLTLWPQPAGDQGTARVTVLPPESGAIAPPKGPGRLSQNGVLTVSQPGGVPLELHLDLLLD